MHEEMRSTASFILSALAAFAVSSCYTDAFSIPRQPNSRVPTQLFSTNALLSLERTAQRDVDQFQGWAAQCGVQAENGFCLAEDSVDGNEDYYAATSTGGAQGSRVLYVPGEMILSADRLAQEYEGYVDASLQVLQQKGLQHLFQRFYLFIKVLVEYERGDESAYYPWLAALPRKWNTAVSMDEFCLSCLPPYIKSLCVAERDQLASFREALQAFDYLSPESKANVELLQFAYNVVFTRSFPTEDGDYRIVPMADMLNHGHPDNVALCYDENGGCEVILKEDVAPGPLHLSYGQPTNPSRFLATYGFLNEAPATFCKILFSNPSQELLDIGYDPNEMVFDTSDGSIAPVVWDVLLYSRLERKPDLADAKDAFYQAHMTGDGETKGSIHRQFQQETCTALLRHVNHILSEVAELTVNMNVFDSSKHPRLPLLKKHHAMVTSTFVKVKDYLMQISG